MHFIETETISYRYFAGENGERDNLSYALDNVSLHADEGQYLCILGRNGSGKSTLAKHLNALLTPEKGTVRIDGMDSKDAEKLWEIRRLAGMVFQNPDNQMVAGTVEEEIAFGPENLGMPSDVIAEKVATSLKQVGMSEEEMNAPQFLSGGKKQRVAIAGILAMEPRCIILDEATAMLDPESRQEIMEIVMRLVREQHITVINITHFMEEALHADRIYIMESGKVFLEGTPEEIFSREKELRAAGLRLPQICQIADELRRRGLAIPAAAITEDALADALNELKKKNGREDLQNP